MASVNDFAPQDLGNVSLNPRGEYDSGTTYEYLDMVSYNGGTYVCIAETEPGEGVALGEPTEGETDSNWQCITTPAELTDEYISLQSDVATNAKVAAASAAEATKAAEEATSSATSAAESASTATEAANASGENKDATAGYAYEAAASAAASAASESNAEKSATSAAESASEAANSAASIEGDVDSSAANAAAAEKSAVAAATSATNASTSEENAAASADKAETSASEAAASAAAASASESNAAASESNAASSEKGAAEAAESAAASESNAAASESNAAASESNAAESESNAAASATLAESWAVGGTSARDGEDEDNAKYYAEQSESSAASASVSAAEAAESAAESEASANTFAVTTLLDGTPETYKATMRKWFRLNGANEYALAGDTASLTALVDTWYEISRDSWCGYTEFYQPDVSAVSTGTKGGDNAGLSCTPSTDTVANQDDYAGLPLFACVDCNWEIGADTLQPVITAIDGITDNFTRYDPDTYVGVLQMAGYIFFEDDEETYKIGYASTIANPYASIQPILESVNPDGTIRTWVVHGKYMNHTTDDGKMSSCSGVIPTAWTSHNTLHTLSAKNGAQYSGGCITDDAWLFLMFTIKYGSLTDDGILQGCVSYSYQYPALVPEEGVKRILITTAQAANLVVGSSVLIGDYTSSTDRGSLYSITGQAGTIITAIETVTIDDTEYAAVYVDTDDVFDTAANGTATEGTTYISTFHWKSGSCDGVLGNDGSPVSCTSGKYPAKLQGIEYSAGAYEVYADVILSLYLGNDETTYYYEPYIVRLRANQSTAVTSNYEATGLTCEQPSSSSWQYIKKRSYANGVFFATEVGGSSSTYLRDGFYMNAATTGAREWLAFGYLTDGSGSGGLSYLYGNHGLTTASWCYAARLSPNGNRGEWTA